MIALCLRTPLFHLPLEELNKSLAGGSIVLQVDGSSFRSVLNNPSEDNIASLFRKIDVDNNGYITKDEFKFLYENLDNMGVVDINSKLEKLMANHNMLADDKLSYEEFSLLVLKVAQW
eukprot:TRINITY_DN6690_c0_g1_i1.p1 TRINITY_DN6690_c0_g1~~TRINITY_DN6690_c0_g1_i1.p1  ORF type:complete len:118 (+),score=36.89 TRINITY_DN6690_c0_g1_i1:76-429(+)